MMPTTRSTPPDLTLVYILLGLVAGLLAALVWR
jgi:hypothetical protein